MRKILAAVTLAALFVACAILAGAATAVSASTACRTVAYVHHGTHLVWRWETRHHKRVHVRVRVRYAKVAHRQECTTTNPGSTTVTLGGTTTTLQAHLDPTFTQDPTNPLAVTYSYSASATQQVTGGPVQPLSDLPSGVLELFSDGSLACSMNVGGATDGGDCPVTYAATGQHTVVTTYTSGSTAATETDSETISPYSTSTTLSISWSPSTAVLSVAATVTTSDGTALSPTAAELGFEVIDGTTGAVAGTFNSLGTDPAACDLKVTRGLVGDTRISYNPSDTDPMLCTEDAADIPGADTPEVEAVFSGQPGYVGSSSTVVVIPG